MEISNIIFLLNNTFYVINKHINSHQELKETAFSLDYNSVFMNGASELRIDIDLIKLPLILKV